MGHEKFRNAMTAEEFSSLFRSDPENERLYRESEIRFDVAARMTAMRKSQAISQKELAQRVGRSQPFIAKLEGGAYDRCGLSTLRTFARALGYDIKIEDMFHSIGAPIFTKESSCAELSDAITLQEAISDALSGISLARWEHKIFGVIPDTQVTTIPKEAATAA